MRKIMNFLRGHIRVTIDCPYPERFVNICAKHHVNVQDMEREDTAIYVTVHRSDYHKLVELSKFGVFTIRSIEKRGAPFLLWRLRRRHMLFAGLILCIAAVWVLSMFVWEIRVSGNETVHTSEILIALEELGVGIGTNRRAIDQDVISNEMLQKIPELCWITLNTHGSRLEVLVREALPIPEILDEKTPALVYAEKPGVITKTVVWNGKQLVQKGDTVLTGDVLITGEMDSIASGIRYVSAMGKIYAKTWYEMTAAIPLQAVGKQYTGEEKTKISLQLAGKQINLFIDSGIPWENYDKIKEKTTLVLPGGAVLPLQVEKTTCREYTVGMRQLNLAAGEAWLKEYLESSIRSRIEEGAICETQYTVSQTDGLLAVTVTAECEEQIGLVRPMMTGEMLAATDTEETT